MAKPASPELEYKITPTEFKAVSDKGEYEGHFSVFGNLDEGNDIVYPGAFTKTIRERGKRVKVFYAHDWEKLIGPPPAVLREDDYGLFASGHLTLDSFWGRETWALMKDNALTEGSFGYEAIKVEYEGADGKPINDPWDIFAPGVIRHLKEVKLYEISPVPLGMNALTSIRAVKAATLIGQAKKAIPAHETDKAPEDTEWDAGAVLKECEGAKQLRLVHAWVDSEGDPDVKSSYKLPHHLANGQVVLKGVQAAGGAIMGARSLSIPEDDIPGVKRHLARHYAQFDRTPPWEEEAGLACYLETLATITGQLKESRVLSTADKEKVQSAIDAMSAALDALNELLAAAEPGKTAHSALLLQQRLRAAELALALR